MTERTPDEDTVDPAVLAFQQEVAEKLIRKGFSPRRTVSQFGLQMSWDPPPQFNWPMAAVLIGLMAFVLGLLLVVRL